MLSAGSLGTLKTEIVRTFAALNATNEAILYAKSPEELYRKVSEAAYFSGDFLASAIFLLEPGTNLLRFAAGCGDDIARLRSIDISIVAGTPEGSGVCGQAFRDQQVIISNDFLNDPRSLAWRDGARTGQVGAAAALPLTCNGRSVGVFLVTRREPGSLSRQIIAMLRRVSANVSFALDNFDHEAARKDGERAMRRLNRMFGAISATNEAILRAKTEQELYQRVCDAAVYSGKSVATAVLLAEPGSIWLKPVAGTGESLHLITRSRFSIDPDNEYGKGISGEAFRTQRPCVNDDLAATVQGGPWQQAQRETGVMACVAVPLTRGGRSVGVLLFFVSKSWAEDDEIIALLARIAENVSFALDNFERASEKAVADQQQERLTRMFAALSATNEAIMRAKSRTELHELVCEAAAKGGRFNSTSILLARPDSEYPEMVAVAGPTAENMRRVKVSFNAEHPEGHGLCGNAFRSRQACVANDLRGDPRGAAFHKFILQRRRQIERGVSAVRLRPARRRDVLHLRRTWIRSRPNSSNCCSGSPTTCRLRWRVSIAPTRRRRPKGRRSVWRACSGALSATNEAIVRARSRRELFELVCEATAQGGKFTSTSIALIRPDSDYLSTSWAPRAQRWPARAK